LLVLAQIVDNYESLARIQSIVGPQLECCGLVVSFEEIKSFVWDLAEGGFAGVYVLTASFDRFVPISSDVADRTADDYYFLATTEGVRIQAVLSADWPFDEDDRVRDGWTGVENMAAS
jgi:hypothetical protein